MSENGSSVNSSYKSCHQYINAVYVRNVYKKYEDSGPPVLNNYCMTVQRGTIYGLLGASGCGKTTILSCIVGLKQWDSGELLVFGEKRVEAKKAGIQGKRIGYMPQEQALFNHLTIEETMQLFGRLYNMTNEDILQRYNHLTKLLQLPTKFKLISELSGGQKRRVSLAVSLTHSPELLVLDEPTTGMDPLLKLKIWDYLYQLAKNLGTTIIVTTHYTEEAKLADTIGVMRRGHLLVEDTPKNLMSLYQTDLLQKVVLQLALDDEANAVKELNNQKDQSHNKNGSNKKSAWKTMITPFSDKESLAVGVFRLAEVVVTTSYTDHWNNGSLEKHGNYGKLGIHFYKSKKEEFCSSLSRIKGLSTVFLLSLYRYPWFLAILLIMPSIQGSLTLSTLGAKPGNMPFGIVNHEVQNWTEECNKDIHRMNFCDLTSLSCKFINKLTQTDTFILNSYDTEEKALQQVHLGKIWGFLVLKQNYSQDMIDLVALNHFSENETIEGSRIPVFMDYSQFVAAFFIVKNLQLAFVDYLRQLASLCYISGWQAELPFTFRQPLYGSYQDNFTDYVMPGVIMCSLMITVCVLTGLMFITDKKQGTLSRSTVAGLGTADIIISHVITEAVVTICQIMIWSLILKYAFDFSMLGSFWLWALMLFLAGICGAVFGLCVGMLCEDEIQGLVIGVFLFVVCVLLGGAVFPIDYMSRFWRYIGQLLPPAMPIVALRSIITRGFGLTHFTVWPGFASLIIWTIIFSICSTIFYKFMKLQ